MASERITTSSTKKSFFVSTLFVLATIAFVAGSIYILYTQKINQVQVLSASVSPPLDNPTARQEIGKSFAIASPEGSGNMQYNIQKAELRKSLVINHLQSTATQGNTFLIVYVKVINSSPKPVQVNTSEYLGMRIADKINTEPALLSNDPVLLNASAVKFVRLAFLVKETERKFLLEIQKGNDMNEELTLELK